MPNFQTSYGCNFYFLNIMIFGTKLRSKINIIRSNLCWFVIILVFLKKIFGGMGSPAPLFQHMWKLGNFFTFSSDCASFDHFKNYFLLIFDHVFVGHVIVNIWITVWSCCMKMPNCYNLIFPQRAGHSDNIVFLFSSAKWSFLMTPWFATFCQICTSFYWTCPYSIINFV